MKLLIVESPAKAKTIGHYLGPGFKVAASVGHVCDLPQKGGLAIEVKPVEGKKDAWTFTPMYSISPEKRKIVGELRAAAKEADEIYLASDPDREGEAIAWHLSRILATAMKNKIVRRVTYNEITKAAVSAALENPRDIDMSQVEAQQARRILDRLVGWLVSPLLWKALPYGNSLSAGRVQSAALRILVEREREIMAFKPEAYWLLGVEARKGTSLFTAKLTKIDGARAEIKAEETANDIINDLKGASLRVAGVMIQQKKRHAMPPFTTSTLQQAASSVCSFPPGRTMSLAQKLYETGLITYMRTDSTNISKEAQTAARKYISSAYGEAFLPTKPNVYRTKVTAQGAHEAIRPTDVMKVPGQQGLEPAADKLYQLIWNRFVASQMSDAQLEQTSVSLVAEKVGGALQHDYLFSASATKVLFEGFLKVIGTSLIKKDDAEDSDEVNSLPTLVKDDTLQAERWLTERKETKPPARYSEASLVKTLEENGVGRPSTYAQIIETLVSRKYADRAKRQLVPSDRGIEVSDWLTEHLEKLFNVGYTAEMEAALDRVEESAAAKSMEARDAMLSAFYREFEVWVKDAQPPPPSTEKFDGLFEMLKHVTQWKAPVKVGRYTYDDQAFVESVHLKRDKNPEQLSERQLHALEKMANFYRAQIPDCGNKLAALGFAVNFGETENKPDPEFLQWCFQTADRIEEMANNNFLKSLRRQVDRGRTLSARQLQMLAKAVGEHAESLEDCAEVRKRLAPYVPGGFEEKGTSREDPVVPDLLKLFDSVTKWHEPVKRGRRVYDDKSFIESIRSQSERRGSLSERQVSALKRVVTMYRDQIPNYEDVEAQFGLPKQEKSPRQ